MKERSPRVIKIAPDGAVTLSMPEMAGQYLVIEEQEGAILLKPYDLRWQNPVSTIAKIGVQLHVAPVLLDRMPEA